MRDYALRGSAVLQLGSPARGLRQRQAALRGRGVAQRLDGDLTAREFVGAEDQRKARAARVGPLELRLDAAPARGAGLSVQMHAAGVTVLMHGAAAGGWGSMKSQFKRADASGARHALIFGADELARGEVALKLLREADAPQRSLALAEAARWAAELRTA